MQPSGNLTLLTAQLQTQLGELNKLSKARELCKAHWDSVKAQKDLWTDGLRKIKDEVRWLVLFCVQNSYIHIYTLKSFFFLGYSQCDYFAGWFAVFDLEAKVGGAISAYCIATVRE